MSQKNFTQFRAALESVADKYGSKKDVLAVKDVFNHTIDFLKSSHCVGQNSIAFEKFGEKVPVFSEAAAQNISPDTVYNFVANTCRVPQSRALACALEVTRILNSGNTVDHSLLAPAQEVAVSSPNVTRITTFGVAGPSAIAGIRADERAALEAFGLDMDKVAIDNRLNVVLTILRARTNFLDRLIPRIPEENVQVTIKIPKGEAYDLAKSQGTTSTVRMGDHRKSLISLFKDPSSLNTNTKLVIPNAANDPDDKVLFNNGPRYLSGVSGNLFDLAKDNNQIGYANTDFSDLISEGSQVTEVVLKAVQSSTTEYFSVPTDYLHTSRFIAPGNSADSGDRQTQFQVLTTLKPGAKMLNGSDSTIVGSEYEDATISFALSFAASLNLKTGTFSGQGIVLKASVAMDDGTAVSGGTATDFATITWSVAAWNMNPRYSEENLRKTTLAARMMTHQHAFEIPVGRTIVSDFSLQQTDDEMVLNMTNSLLQLGNSTRGLDIIESKLREAYDRTTFEKANPGLVTLDNDFASTTAAGSLCLPTVVEETIDFSDVAVMRESERMTELHARTTARILSIWSRIFNESLYLRNLEPGERRVIKVITSTYIRSVLFGITHYHPTLGTAEQAENNGQVVSDSGTEADYSFILPDGTKVDVVGIEYEQIAGKILMFPVRESNPTHVTSLGAIHDRGTFVGAYTPTNQNAVLRRQLANSREIPYVTNPTGVILTVTGLPDHLGPSANLDNAA